MIPTCFYCWITLKIWAIKSQMLVIYLLSLIFINTLFDFTIFCLFLSMVKVSYERRLKELVLELYDKFLSYIVVHDTRGNDNVYFNLRCCISIKVWVPVKSAYSNFCVAMVTLIFQQVLHLDFIRHWINVKFWWLLTYFFFQKFLCTGTNFILL